MKLTTTIALTTIFSAAIGQASFAQSPKVILERTAHVYANKSAVKAVMDMHMTLGPMGTIGTKAVIYQSGGKKYRVETTMLPGPMAAKVGQNANTLMVATGKYLYMYRPAMNQYSVFPENKPGVGGGPMQSPSQSLMSASGLKKMEATVVGPAKMVSFDNIPCWAIATRSKMANQIVTVYIARSSYLVKGVTMVMNYGKMNMSMKALFTSVSFPKSLPASLFTFTPPKGAVKMATVMPGGMP